VLSVVDPSVPAVPPAPSVEELLVLLAQRDALIAVLAGRGGAGRGAGSAVEEELAELLQAAE